MRWSPQVWIHLQADHTLLSHLPPQALQPWPHSKVTVRKSQCPSHGGRGPRIYWQERLTHKERPETLLKSCSEFWIHTSRPLFSWDVEAKPDV